MRTEPTSGSIADTDGAVLNARNAAPGQTVARRPGTAYTSEMGLSVAINDIGLVTMPDGRRFAIAVMESGSRASFEAQEDAIARLARTAWDALLRA